MKAVHQIVSIIMAIMLLSCNNSNSKKMEGKENFSWAVTVTAPFNYPIEIHRGYLGNDKKMMAAFISTGLTEDGWVYDGDALSGGNEIPTLLSLTWISYAEKKFWKIETSIDKTTQDKIRQLFEEGYMRKAKNGKLSHITYKKITVGLAPGGTVVLWLSGLNKKVEIAHYQAVETDVSANEFYRNPRELTQQEFYDYYYDASISKETQAYIKRNGVPVKLWKEFRTRYNYRFNIHFYKADKESSDRETEYVNGEKEIMSVEDLNAYQTKPLPSYCRFWFSQYNAEAEFDGEEVLKAFKKLAAAHPGKKIEIEAKVAFMYKTTTFAVRCEGDEIPLEKTVVRMWKN
ncbi:DUF2931 family protein [Flavobacterium sp. TR2]|uniref:DUF2931 family protein n=1 Tax=Flavobacterium sp. TR2 TaxID=2977321 RepID=UPI0021B0F5F8|nr:DUF2931 family protein [Flavobacterium sp. TR2]UWY27569.1 DUF2931 family protein [Flavobacterium sp. TR2]